MNPEKLEKFRKVLETMLAELQTGTNRTVDEMNEERANFPDPTDRATLEADRNFELRIRDRERQLISKVREALKRLDSGEFGFCEICEEPIGEARLQARPVTTLCIDCKTEQERRERLGS